jgi:hypothetical protein
MNITTNLDCQIEETTLIYWHQFNPTSISLSGQNNLTLQFTPESLTVLLKLMQHLEDIKTYLLSKKQQELDKLKKNSSLLIPPSCPYQTVNNNGNLALSTTSEEIPF